METTSFAARVENIVTRLYASDDLMPSRREVEDALQPFVAELLQKPLAEAKAYIRASFSHTGYQALVVRMFKGQTV